MSDGKHVSSLGGRAYSLPDEGGGVTKQNKEAYISIPKAFIRQLGAVIMDYPEIFENIEILPTPQGITFKSGD